MTAHNEFLKERSSRIEELSKDSEFKANSSSWLEASMRKKYVYNFDWLGRPIIQYPQDMVAIQEIIWKTRPDVVIEIFKKNGYLAKHDLLVYSFGQKENNFAASDTIRLIEVN